MDGYEIDLPLGMYSVFVFMVDPEEDDLFQAEIYAIGLPTAEGVDLTGIESLAAQSYDDMHSLVSDVPVHVIPGGPCYLDFILFDDELDPDLPGSFYEVFEDQQDIFGYECASCGTEVTSVVCTCGAVIDEMVCPGCGVSTQVSDICSKCYLDIDSLVCHQCGRSITELDCPKCGSSIPV